MSDIESALWQKYKDQDVLIYGLHSTSESPQLIADFVEQAGLTYPVLGDQAFTKGAFAFPRQGTGFPFPRDVVLGKDLTVRSLKSSFDVREMDDLIEQLLAEP